MSDDTPLSGVSSDIEEAPTTAPEFRHAGLEMLYAERYVKHPRENWLPKNNEYVVYVQSMNRLAARGA